MQLRRRRPTLSLCIPQTTRDTVFEEIRTPRPRSTRSVRSRASSQSHSPASQNHRLPVEILADIFLHCLPTINEIPPPCLTNQAPLALTSVCREWRLVALNMPWLWSSPQIRLPPLTNMSSMGLKCQLDGIELWLKRSGSTLPLSLSLMIYRGLEHSDSGWEDNTLKLMQLLMQYSHRITQLGVFSLQTMHYLLRSLSTMDSIQFPALKSIYIRLAVQRGTTKGVVLADLMYHSRKMMPALEKLDINGMTSSAARHLTQTRSWSSNITQLVLNSSSSSRRRSSGLGSSNSHELGPSDILSILSRNPQLQSFQAIITLHAYRPCSSLANLPFLQKLDIRFEVPPNAALIPYPDQDIYRFFESMSCPALRTLSVAYAGIPSLTEVPFLSWLSVPFSQQASKFGMRHNTRVDKLRDLKLEVAMSPEALTDCLVLLPPSVRTLEIVDLGQIDVEGVGVVFKHTVQDSHLELLTRRSTNESGSNIDFSSSAKRDYNICPRLKTFRLIVSGFLSLAYLTPTPRTSTSSLHPNHQPLLDWQRRSGVSRAALHRLIDSRKQTLLPSSNTGFRKRVLRECEVFLSPSLSSYYTLDSLSL